MILRIRDDKHDLVANSLIDQSIKLNCYRGEALEETLKIPTYLSGREPFDPLAEADQVNEANI